MPFNPSVPVPQFDVDPLNHHRLEETSLALLAEFLAGWFDGKRHQLGHKSYIFPSGDLAFQASAGKQPLNGFAIHVIGSTTKTVRKFFTPSANNSKLWFFNDQEWTVMIRSSVQGERPDNHNSESLCQMVADLVYAIFTTPTATIHLARKGMMRLKAEPHQPLASNEYKMRRIILRGQLQCQEGSGGGAFAANERLFAANDGFLSAP